MHSGTQTRPGAGECVVVTPIYRLPLSPDESISLAQLRRVLRRRPRTFVAPESLEVPDAFLDGETIERVPDHFLADIAGYNRLLLSERFYRAFARWRHILVYQLDCLVFRDELDHWCALGRDYCAAPWFADFAPDTAGGLWAVGNGGFSLRRVASALRTLGTRTPRGRAYPMKRAAGEDGAAWTPSARPARAGEYRERLGWYQRARSALSRWTVADEVTRFAFNEDLFWSLEAVKFDARFQVASVEEALPFAFEMAPRWCFERNRRRLPFGCHAWPRYDRAFWLAQLAAQEAGA